MAETEHGIYFVEEIAKGIYKFYEQRNASIYLVLGEKKACLIDTAYGLTNLKELVEHYTDLPVTVVNTHGHIDHVLGNHWFENCYLNSADKFMYYEIIMEFSMMINEPWVQDFYGDFVKEIDAEEVNFPEPQNISEGDVIDLGGKILGDSIIENLWLFLEESEDPETYLESLKKIRDILTKAGIEKIYNGHFSYEPIAINRLDDMVDAMEAIVAGKLEGTEVENHAGRGIEYSHKDWKVICPLKE